MPGIFPKIQTIYQQQFPPKEREGADARGARDATASAAAMSRAVRESHDCDSAVRVRINVRFRSESPLVFRSRRH